jgi:hypothetical protein
MCEMRSCRWVDALRRQAAEERAVTVVETELLINAVHRKFDGVRLWLRRLIFFLVLSVLCSRVAIFRLNSSLTIFMRRRLYQDWIEDLVQAQQSVRVKRQLETPEEFGSKKRQISLSPDIPLPPPPPPPPPHVTSPVPGSDEESCWINGSEDMLA